MSNTDKAEKRTIESIHLKNFEVHQDTLIEFSPGITVIHGSSDQGKSSVRKALTWVAHNRPVGPKRVRDNATDCRVTIRCSDCPAISRGRKNDKNYYAVEGSKVGGVKHQLFKAFKTKVPDEVAELLDLSPANIHEQFKEYYLLQDTPGQVAKTIHEMLGMELITNTTSIVNSKIAYQTKVLAGRKAKLEEIEKEIAVYAHVEEVEKELQDLELSLMSHEKVVADIHRLTEALDRWASIEEKIKQSTIPDGVEKEAKAIYKELTDIEELQTKTVKLGEAIEDVVTIQGRLASISEQTAVEKEALAIQKDISYIVTLEEKINSLERLLKSIAITTKDIRSSNEKRIKAEQELAEYKKKIKVCPLCKGPLNS